MSDQRESSVAPARAGARPAVRSLVDGSTEAVCPRARPRGASSSKALALFLLAGATGLGWIVAELSRTDRGEPVLNGAGVCAVAHVLVFAIWGAAWGLCWGKVLGRKGGVPFAVFTAGLVAALGEWMERFLPGHHFDLGDLGLNLVGVLTGLAAACWLHRRTRAAASSSTSGAADRSKAREAESP